MATALGCVASHPGTDAPAADCGSSPAARDVDLLWVVQNRGTSYDAEFSAERTVEPLVRALRARVDGAVRMGVLNGHVSPTGILAHGSCVAGASGHDGVLRDRTRDGELVDPVVVFPEGAAIDAPLRALLDLVRPSVVDECGSELLEAALRAITPSSVRLVLPEGAAVHGDRENAALTRPGDVLVLVFVSFMDDCSWNERVVPGVPLDCPAEEPDCCEHVVFPTDRYIRGFRTAAAALGVELVLVSLTTVTEPDVSAAEWRMRTDPEAACSTPDSPSVFVEMPYRILAVSEALAPASTSQSACRNEAGDGILANIDTIADRIAQAACD